MEPRTAHAGNAWTRWMLAWALVAACAPTRTEQRPSPLEPGQLACNKEEGLMVRDAQNGRLDDAAACLQRMKVYCPEWRVRRAADFLAKVRAGSWGVAAPPPVPKTFPACLAHVERVGLPPWHPGFMAAVDVDPHKCNAVDLDDAVAVLRHRLALKCAATIQRIHTDSDAGNQDGVAASLAQAQLQCTPQELAALEKQLRQDVPDGGE